MTYEQFVEAARYAISTLDQDQIDYAWYIIGKTHLYNLPNDIESALLDGMDEWCNDNDIDPDEWRKNWSIIDVWCDGQTNDEQLNESYSTKKVNDYYKGVTKGAVINGLRGFLTLMLDYELYCKKALADIVAYYNKLGIKVISSVIHGETNYESDGFTIKLDRKSVEEYLAKNNCNYDGEEPQYVDELMADDLRNLTIDGWVTAGKNAEMMFNTLWMMKSQWSIGKPTIYRPTGDIEFIFDTEPDNTVTIEYQPETFEFMDYMLNKVTDKYEIDNITNCAKYA